MGKVRPFFKTVIFRDELVRLTAQHPTRLTVIHTLTREPNARALGPAVREGRISLPLLREVIEPTDDCYVYVCGPGISHWDVVAAREAGKAPEPRFLESVLAQLRELGVPPDRVKRESYG